MNRIINFLYLKIHFKDLKQTLCVYQHGICHFFFFTQLSPIGQTYTTFFYVITFPFHIVFLYYYKLSYNFYSPLPLIQNPHIFFNSADISLSGGVPKCAQYAELFSSISRMFNSQERFIQ